MRTLQLNCRFKKDGADPEGLKYWSGQLDTATVSRGVLVSTILASAHGFKGDVIWGWTADLLDNKASVGRTFAITMGLGYNTPEESIKQGMAIAAAITPTDTNAALKLVGISVGDLLLT